MWCVRVFGAAPVRGTCSDWAGRVPLTSAVKRAVSLVAIWSDCAWVMRPAATAAMSSDFVAAMSASISPAADFPLVAAATWASV